MEQVVQSALVLILMAKDSLDHGDPWCPIVRYDCQTRKHIKPIYFLEILRILCLKTAWVAININKHTKTKITPPDSMIPSTVLSAEPEPGTGAWTTQQLRGLTLAPHAQGTKHRSPRLHQQLRHPDCLQHQFPMRTAAFRRSGSPHPGSAR